MMDNDVYIVLVRVQKLRNNLTDRKCVFSGIQKVFKIWMC